VAARVSEHSKCCGSPLRVSLSPLVIALYFLLALNRQNCTMADVADTLVARRSKRSTAGNRMEAVLAEIAMQGADPDENEVEDIDFVAQGSLIVILLLWLL
jgi:hypothetical protein